MLWLEEGEVSKIQTKNPAYGRQRISRPMRIVAPIPQQGGPRIHKNQKKIKNGKNNPKRKTQKHLQICQNQRYIPFDQRSLIHREAWFPPRDKQTRKQTDRHRDSMKESAKGRFFENSFWLHKFLNFDICHNYSFQPNGIYQRKRISSYHNICICSSNVYCSESTHDIRLTHYVTMLQLCDYHPPGIQTRLCKAVQALLCFQQLSALWMTQRQHYSLLPS